MLDINFDAFIRTVQTVSPSDSVQESEIRVGNVLQAAVDNVPVTDSTPSFGMINDAIGFVDDASGFVKGAQQTIYITDPKYIIRHDFGGY